MSNYPYNPGYPQSGPTYTTISIAPLPGTQTSTPASYSGSLTLTPSSSGYGGTPNFGGTVTLTPSNIMTGNTQGGWSATIYGPIQMIQAPQTDEEIILFLVGQMLQGSGPSSGRTEEARKRMAGNAVLDARAILDALRKIKQVTDVLSQGSSQGEEANAKQQP